MTKRVLVATYILLFFFYFFGFGLLGNLNSGIPYSWEKALAPLKLSRYFYTIVTVLLAHKVVFPGFYHRRPWWKPALAIVGLLLFFIVLRYVIEELIYPATVGYSNYFKGTSLRFYFIDNLYFGILPVLIGFVLFLIDEHIKARTQQKKLLALNREIELNFLQAQMNPHFLFNALNSLYALATEKHPGTANSILQLADMMRYVTEAKGKTVTLEKEMNFVKALLESEQLRRDYPLQAKFSIDDRALRLDVPPLLLVPLIENALKHGDLADPLSPLRLIIATNPGKLYIKVENKLRKDTGIRRQGTGTGLANLRRRLALLYSDGKYDLDTNTHDGLFTINLHIPVN